MPKFTVIEVQECLVLRRFVHEVEAETPTEALTKAAQGESEFASDREQGRAVGDEEYGESGWAVETGDNDAEQEALDNFGDRDVDERYAGDADEHVCDDDCRSHGCTNRFN